MNLTARMPSDRVIFSFYKPGEDLVWTSWTWTTCSWRQRGETCCKVKIKLFSGIWFISVFSSVEKWIWRARSIRGKPEENSWDSLERVDPHREEHLLGRTAHSARNEETIHERTGKPDSEDAQGKANFEKFIVGSDKIVPNIQWYGECSWLQHWMQSHSWERVIPRCRMLCRMKKR